MKIETNKNYERLTDNYLFSEIGRRVAEFKIKNPREKVINLGIGDVTLPLSQTVIAAMKKACDEQSDKETFRGYAPDGGYEFLRSAISDYYKNYGVCVDKNEIFVSDGAKSDAGNLTELFGENTVYIPDPVYPVYLDSCIMSGRNIVFMKATKENGYLPMPDKNYSTGIYYLCSPNNPTGAVYIGRQLCEWVDFAKDTGSLIIFDAAYEAFISGTFPHSVYEIRGAEYCAVEICSFSKTAGFTGTRCGYTVIPFTLASQGVSLNKMWRRRQSAKFNGVPYIVQRGAWAAYSGEGIRECRENIKYYMENAFLLANLFKKKGIEFTGGENAPYIWLKCPHNMTSWQFFDFLLEKACLAGTPGEGFGECGKGYFRLSSFGDRADVIDAVQRLDYLL